MAFELSALSVDEVPMHGVFWTRHSFFHEGLIGTSCKTVLQLSFINKILVLSLYHCDCLKRGKSFSSFKIWCDLQLSHCDDS